MRAPRNLRMEADGALVFRLHETDIATKRGSRLVLDTGGWLTALTVRGMNEALEAFGLKGTVSRKGGALSATVDGYTAVEGSTHTITFERD